MNLRRAGPALMLALLGAVLAQTATTFSLKRDDTELVITNLGLASNGARTVGNNRNCEEGQRLTIVYGASPGSVETQVEDALLTSSLALIRTPEGAQQGSAAETLELSDDTVTLGRPGCIEERTAAAEPVVTLKQGRTSVTGSRFFLDQGTDEGLMDGPIELVRENEDGSEALRAQAEQMVFGVNEQASTLLGKVRVSSAERTTTGDRLELDEEAGTALLEGAPARSVKGEDVLEGKRLLYYLDSDDVVVLGNVKGELEVELD